MLPITLRPVWSSTVIVSALLVLAACGTDEPAVAASPVPQLIAEAPPSSVGPAPVAASPTPVPTEAASPTSTPLPTTVTAPVPAVAASPTATPLPPATARPTAPVSKSEPSPAPVDVLSQTAWSILRVLTDDHSPRETATDEELAAADYLLDEFAAIGYRVELQPFTFETLSKQSRTLSLDGAGLGDVRALPFRFSGEGRISGALADAGLARAEDVELADLDGKIALIKRGTIRFNEKVKRVASAGAIAAVIYNNSPDLFGGTLQELAEIPAVAISGADGQAVHSALSESEVRASVSVETEVYRSRNVVAEMSPSTGTAPGPNNAAERVVVLGAHFDTVPNTQGANDNGSGVATLLTMAQEAAGRDYPFSLRFIAFGSEEVGLFGSRHYVDTLPQAERDKIVAMFNFDALASGTLTQVLGTRELREQALELAEANEIDVEALLSLGGFSSDHAPFAEADIPHLALFANEFSRINSSADTIEFVRPELLGAAAFVGLAMLDLLAGS